MIIAQYLGSQLLVTAGVYLAVVCPLRYNFAFFALQR